MSLIMMVCSRIHVTILALFLDTTLSVFTILKNNTFSYKTMTSMYGCLIISFVLFPLIHNIGSKITIHFNHINLIVFQGK